MVSTGLWQNIRRTDAVLQHLCVSQYYDIPIVSLRSLLLPSIHADSSLIGTWFWNRKRYAGNGDSYDPRPVSDGPRRYAEYTSTKRVMRSRRHW